MLRVSRRLWSASNINTVVILGGGLMGSGIATVCAAGKKRAIVVDLDEKACQNAKKYFDKAIGWINKKKSAFQHRDLDLASATALASFTTDRAAAVREADLVIEAVPEVLKIKNQVFAEVAPLLKADALLATNTSSLSVDAMQGPLPAALQGRFGGLHYFSPVEKMGLVEIVRGGATTDSTMDRFKAFVKEIGKDGITCKDTPGFAVNRLLVPFMLEALRMLERGDVGMEDIDIAMVKGANHPVGPFRLADMVGLDVLKHIVDFWHAQYPENPLFNPSPLLNQKVAAGHLGMKTGQGFYNWKAQ